MTRPNYGRQPPGGATQDESVVIIKQKYLTYLILITPDYST